MSDAIFPSVNVLWRRVSSLLPLMFLLSVSTAIAAPDIILHNARVLVVDEPFSQVEAIAIEDGRIWAIGKNYAVKALAGPDTRLEDMAGRTLIPGLIDNHMHLIRSARRWQGEVRLDGLQSYQQALDRIAEKARSLPEGSWITVTGGFVDHQFLDQPDGFSLEDLDRVAPSHPVYLQHLFDWAYVNSKALEMIGVDAHRVQKPRSGLMLHKSGKPAGVVSGAVQTLLEKQIPVLSGDERERVIKGMLAYINQLGLTAVLDVGGFDTFPDDYLPFEKLAQQQPLNVRLYYLQQLIPWHKGWGKPPNISELESGREPFSDRFRRLGVGEQLYLPVQDSASRAAKSDEFTRKQFSHFVTRLADAETHLHLHAVNDESIRQHLDVFEPLSERYNLRPLRWTFAHADGISPETMVRVRDLGLNVAIHARPWLIGHRFQRQFGERAKQMTPMKGLIENDVAWGLGSDSPVVASMNPFHTLDWAVNGTMVDGRPLSDQHIDREQALVAHTRSNARLLFAENHLGTLEPGKRADLVVLDRHYLDIPAEDIRHIRPLGTMVDGRWVYRAEQL